MKEEISPQLGTIRNWMQPAMVEQNGTRRVYLHICISYDIKIFNFNDFTSLKSNLENPLSVK